MKKDDKYIVFADKKQKSKGKQQRSHLYLQNKHTT